MHKDGDMQLTTCTHTNTYTQTNIQAHNIHIYTDKHIHTDRQPDTRNGIHTYRLTMRQIQTHRATIYIHTHIHTDRDTDKHINRHHKYIETIRQIHTRIYI